jgi:hypothetical protein
MFIFVVSLYHILHASSIALLNLPIIPKGKEKQFMPNVIFYEVQSAIKEDAHYFVDLLPLITSV